MKKKKTLFRNFDSRSYNVCIVRNSSKCESFYYCIQKWRTKVEFDVRC